MMVIFHVCYQNLHVSIFQITDVMGPMCLPSILMKMLIAVGLVICKQTFCKSRRFLFNYCFEVKVEMHILCWLGFLRYTNYLINAY